MGIDSIRLLTNNPDKARQLSVRGMTVSEQVPLIVGVGEHNRGYLGTKRDRMGHQLPDDIGSLIELEGHAS